MIHIYSKYRKLFLFGKCLSDFNFDLMMAVVLYILRFLSFGHLGVRGMAMGGD
jgi:hypothetical protein